VFVTVAIPAVAQTGATGDEKAIRDAIARIDRGEATPSTSDRVFFTGALKQAQVGNQPAVPIPGEDEPANRLPNSQRSKTAPQRIEIAKSGELAYEFSHRELSYQLKDRKTVNVPTSFLRVWRKEAGQWKVAAMFSRERLP
jgi:hypothetical protein